VASPFILSGDDAANVAATRALLAEDPSRLLAVMRRRRARYLLVTPRPSVEQLARTVGAAPPADPVITGLLADPPRVPAGLRLVESSPHARFYELDAGT
jgi:hypothetical protein